MLDPTSRENLKFKDLLKVVWGHILHTTTACRRRKFDCRFHCILMCVQVLIDWINSELEEERIIVKDLEEDCYDGQVLQKLFGEKLVSLASQLSH